MKRVSLRPQTFLLLWHRALPGHAAACALAQPHRPDQPPPCSCGWAEAEAIRARLRRAEPAR